MATVGLQIEGEGEMERWTERESDRRERNIPKKAIYHSSETLPSLLNISCTMIHVFSLDLIVFLESWCHTSWLMELKQYAFTSRQLSSNSSSLSH
jgi:hypothetical protein